MSQICRGRHRINEPPAADKRADCSALCLLLLRRVTLAQRGQGDVNDMYTEGGANAIPAGTQSEPSRRRSRTPSHTKRRRAAPPRGRPAAGPTLARSLAACIAASDTSDLSVAYCCCSCFEFFDDILRNGKVVVAFEQRLPLAAGAHVLQVVVDCGRLRFARTGEQGVFREGEDVCEVAQRIRLLLERDRGRHLVPGFGHARRREWF